MRMFCVAKEKAVSEAEWKMSPFNIFVFPIIASLPTYKNGGVRIKDQMDK
jgi:hypothetical protein